MSERGDENVVKQVFLVPRGKGVPSSERVLVMSLFVTEEEEEEEESLFKADAVNEEDSERDRATQV